MYPVISEDLTRGNRQIEEKDTICSDDSLETSKGTPEASTARVSALTQGVLRRRSSRDTDRSRIRSRRCRLRVEQAVRSAGAGAGRRTGGFTCIGGMSWFTGRRGGVRADQVTE